MNTVYRILIGATFFSIMPVSPLDARPAHPDAGLHITNIITDPLPTMPTGHTSASRVIKLKIKPDFNITAIERDIKNLAYSPQADDETGDPIDDTGTPAVAAFKTPWDVRVKRGELVMIKIHINHKRIDFYQPEPVSGAKDATGAKVCRLGRPIPTSGDVKALRVFCQLPAYGTDVGLNINLVFTQTDAATGITYQTPISIDPHIKNDG